MSNLASLTSAQLIKAAKIKDKIGKLEKQLEELLGSSVPAAKPTAKPGRKKNKMSAAGRARIAEAQKLRWAKINAGKKAAKKS